MDTKIFILTWVYCGKASEVKRGDVKLIQAHRTQLKKQPQYKQGYFEIRTPEGFKNKPILNKK
jgi:hypothetical protein